MKACTQCFGAKKHRGIGMMMIKCDLCNGTGAILTVANNSNKIENKETLIKTKKSRKERIHAEEKVAE